MAGSWGRNRRDWGTDAVGDRARRGKEVKGETRRGGEEVLGRRKGRTKRIRSASRSESKSVRVWDRKLGRGSRSSRRGDTDRIERTWREGGKGKIRREWRSCRRGECSDRRVAEIQRIDEASIVRSRTWDGESESVLTAPRAD